MPFLRAWLRSIAVRLAAAFGLGREGDRSAERVLVLGKGTLADTLLAEVGASGGPRYTVVGIVGEPRSDFCRDLERLRPDRIVVAFDDRRSHLPVLHLVDARSRGIAVEEGTRFY